jgi:hypothetical protein
MVESNIRRGTIKVFKQNYKKLEFRHDQKIIERTVLQRIICSNREFQTDEFETLMLDGILTPQIFPQDKIFLETFTFCTTLTFNSCNII